MHSSEVQAFLELVYTKHLPKWCFLLFTSSCTNLGYSFGKYLDIKAANSLCSVWSWCSIVSLHYMGLEDEADLWLTSNFPPLLGVIHTTLHVRAYHRLQWIEIWSVPIQSSFINSNHKPLLSSVNESSQYQTCISSLATVDIEFERVHMTT